MLQEIQTGVQIQTNTFTLTTAAANAVQNILSERKLDGYALRVYVAGGGCCGVQFGMALDNNIQPGDHTYQFQDLQVLVDDMTLGYLNGAKIDFVNDPERGAGFLVDAPSNTGSCACGEHSHSEAEGSSCACGGECSCNN